MIFFIDKKIMDIFKYVYIESFKHGFKHGKEKGIENANI